MTFSDALVTAAVNLQRASPGKWRQIHPDVYVSAFNDGYDCARLLVPQLVQELPLKSMPIALTPCDGTLLVTSNESAEGQRAALSYALAQLEKSSRWISAEFLALRESFWIEHDLVDAEALRLQKLLATRLAKSSYDQQKKLLERAASARPAEPAPFIANYMAYESGGVAFSIATWTEAVEAWLPKADYICFVAGGGQVEPRVVIAEWSIAFDFLEADMITVENVLPVRFHVNAFPSAEVVGAIEALQRAQGRPIPGSN